MDQRREPRFRADQPVTLTVLTTPRRKVDARIANASGRGLGIWTSALVEPGAALEIQMEDGVMLGEAIYCRREGEGHFIGIELDQVLVGLTELGRSLAAFASETAVER